jgi:hypothetical protein
LEVARYASKYARYTSKYTQIEIHSRYGRNTGGIHTRYIKIHHHRFRHSELPKYTYKYSKIRVQYDRKYTSGNSVVEYARDTDEIRNEIRNEIHRNTARYGKIRRTIKLGHLRDAAAPAPRHCCRCNGQPRCRAQWTPQHQHQMAAQVANATEELLRGSAAATCSVRILCVFQPYSCVFQPYLCVFQPSSVFECVSLCISMCILCVSCDPILNQKYAVCVFQAYSSRISECVEIRVFLCVF